MKKLFLGLCLWLGLASAVLAQGGINSVPQIGVSTAILKQNTYSAVSIGLVPASSATDFFCISGSTTKSISVKRINISGTAGTAITAPITLLRRASLDTGGTPASTTANPANTVAANVSSNPAATAVLVAYTANPTIVDSSPVYLRTGSAGLPLSSAGTSSPLTMIFGEQIAVFVQAADIARNTAQQLCLNLNATSISSGVLGVDITWVEN